MIKNKKVLGIIPAREGSKGLPEKNIKELCGKPLIHWTIEKAQLSKYIDEIIITTDSEKIAKIAEIKNVKIPFLRPKELAEDDTPMFKVVLHALDFYKMHNYIFDLIVLLEPTSPLREDDDIDIMLEKLINNYNSYDAIVSIGEIKEHPSIVKKIMGKNTESFCSGVKMQLRRQDNIPAYFPYGVAYIVKVDTFIKEKTFYPKRTTYHIIKRYQNYEIDDIYDFIAVENIMRYQWRLK